MKKIVLLCMLVFGLYPMLKEGKIQLNLLTACAQGWGGELDPVTIYPDSPPPSFPAIPPSNPPSNPPMDGGGGGDGGEWSGGGSGGGYPSDYNPNAGSQTPTPGCNQTAIDSQYSVNYQFTAYGINTKMLELIILTNLSDLAPRQDEQEFNVERVGPNPHTFSPTVTLGPTGGGTNITNWTVAKVHTHPFGTEPYPSATDIYTLMNGYDFSGRFRDSYIKAANGTRYNLHVSDPAKMNAFKTNHGNFADLATNKFKVGSDLETKFNKAETDLRAMGYTIAEAKERAMAFVLEDSGITLLKAPSGSNNFTKIGLAEAKNADGTPKMVNGKQVYDKQDCPR